MTPTLLIVDDEPRIFGALRRALHREQLQLLSASSGQQALEILERQAVDVILADENMPGMNGSRLLAEVSRRWPATVRMMLTGTADMDVVCKAVNEGRISRIFTKPCNEAELIIAIRDALTGGEGSAIWPAGGPGATTTGTTGPDTTDGTFSPSTTSHGTTFGDTPPASAPGTTTTPAGDLRLVDATGSPESPTSDVIDLGDGDDVDDIMAELNRMTK